MNTQLKEGDTLYILMRDFVGKHEIRKVEGSIATLNNGRKCRAWLEPHPDNRERLVTPFVDMEQPEVMEAESPELSEKFEAYSRYCESLFAAGNIVAELRMLDYREGTAFYGNMLTLLARAQGVLDSIKDVEEKKEC